MAPRLKIAWAGSAVDPVSVGHLALWEELLEMDFDVIYVVVAGVRKGKKPRVSPDDRVAMTLLAVPSKWLLRKRPKLKLVFQDAYSWNTPTITWLRRVRRCHPDAEITLVTGADSVCGGLDDLDNWIGGKEIREKWKVLIFPRVHFAGARKLKRILKPYPNFTVADAVLPDVACRNIRERIRLGKRWKHLVPPSTAHYIQVHNLYLYRLVEKGGDNVQTDDEPFRWNSDGLYPTETSMG